jgi:tetratricopeptide (TPR) repeat protein
MIIAGLLMFTSVSGQVDTLKLQADQAYVEENYADAAAAYEKILSQEYVSAELYFNLGNAYFKSGQIASSILNYERALKLAPADEDVLFNLRLANLSVKDRVEEIPQMFFVRWWQTVLNVFTVDGWAWSVVIAVLLSLFGFLLFKFSSEEGIRRLMFYTAVIAFSWASFSLYAAQKSFNHAVNDDRAVVFAYTINAKSAPDEKGKDLFVIHEGLVVTISDELNGWVRIKLSNGNVGWVESRVVVPI